MKVYMVTDGKYSDYSVDGIYSTMKKAELAKKLYDSSNEIVEMEVDHYPDHPEGMFYYKVRMDSAGNTDHVRIYNAAYKGEHVWLPWGDGSCVAFNVWARDEEHAIKIANERRIMLLANGEWTADCDVWKQRMMEKRG